jgi:hypothetical protein
MCLEVIHILPTETTPEIILDPEGFIKIKGRALGLNKKEVPDLIKSWIETYRNCPVEITEVVIALEYLNSFTTKILLSALQEIMQIKTILRS